MGAPEARSAPGPTAAAGRAARTQSLECPIPCVSDRGTTGSLGRVEQGRIQPGRAGLASQELLPEEELWRDEGSDYSGWFCVRTDPFPCPAEGCTFVAVFMTAAHLILVWERSDDPNLLHHAQRAKEVGRNPRIEEYASGYGPSASYYAWEAAGGPVHGVRAR